MTTPEVLDYLKIRRHVMLLSRGSGSNQTRLPTISELCDRFEVSRPTVCKALKELTEQGYIISRRGVGSFTNPAMFNFPGVQRLPHVGLLLQEGMSVYLMNYLGGMLGELIKQLVAIPVILRQINLGSVNQEIIRRDILNEKLDLLVWVGHVDNFFERSQQLRESGLPVIYVDPRWSFPGSVMLNYEEWGYRCGKLLLAENRRKVAFLHNQPGVNRPYDGVRQAFAEAGVTLDENLFFDDSVNALTEIDRLFRYKVPIDAVFNPMLGDNELSELLLKADPESPQKCAIIQSELSCKNQAGFKEICFGVPFEVIAAETVALVKQKLSGDPGYPTGTKVELPLIVR